MSSFDEKNRCRALDSTKPSLPMQHLRQHHPAGEHDAVAPLFTRPTTDTPAGAKRSPSAAVGRHRRVDGENDMGLDFGSTPSNELCPGPGRWHEWRCGATRLRLFCRLNLRRSSLIERTLVVVIATAAVGGTTLTIAPQAHAVPAPEVEYLYNVTVRRHYNFPDTTDAVRYGYGICDRISAGDSYAQVMGDVKSAVTPNDEFAANYLISYAVNILCPAQIWQLRNSATHYSPPA